MKTLYLGILFAACTVALPCRAQFEADFDFGDAPSDRYPTLLSDDGARHGVGFPINPFMGASVDHEADGQPSEFADGDDLAGVDDEDGVGLPTALVAGTPFTVTIDIDPAAFYGQLSAWIDFNGDGDWSDVGEQIFTNVVLFSGVHFLMAATPPTARPGLTYARFRFSTEQNLAPWGPAPDGEVEDYAVMIEGEKWTMDFGDAPNAGYRTYLSSDGPRHTITEGGPFLGGSVDVEGDGRPTYAADGDDMIDVDDEDGVWIDGPLNPGSNFVCSVSMQQSPVGAYVNAWFDFNADGDWDDAGEKILSDVWIDSGDTLHVTNSVPSDSPGGHTYARFRCSSVPGLGTFGAAVDGEVEDYQLSILHPAPAETVVITGIQRDATHTTVRWDASSNAVYQLQACADLGVVSWDDVGNPVRSPANQQVDSSSEPLRFYRLVLPFVAP